MGTNVLRERFIKNHTSISIFIGAACFLFTIFDYSIYAQQKNNNAPLVMSLSIPSPKVCLGSESILLNVDISNSDKEAITVDRNFLWYGFISVDYKVGNKIKESWASGGNGKYPYNGDFVSIRPGEKRTESHQFSLSKNNNVKKNTFFERTGIYTVQLQYHAADWDARDIELRKRLYKNPVWTNKMSFEIVECRK